MMKAHENLEIGSAVAPREYRITQEKINTYSRYAFHGKDTKNIHTDDEVARRAGLPRALAQGRYPVGYLSEYLLDVFGEGWIRGGKLDVSLVKPIFPGDTLTLRGVVREKLPEGTFTRIILDVWIENQNGEKATVGSASGLAES
ncbi:MAG: MaoC family dehydratase [Thermodesulfobacteriota bacterium]